MIVTLHKPDGQSLNAKVEVEHGAIILHSRGGAFGKSNLRNPDYRPALTLILQKLAAGDLRPHDILLDSRPAQSWPKPERLVLKGDEHDQPVEVLVTLIAQRSAALGRTDSSIGHGNSTRRLRIEVPGAAIKALITVLDASTPTGSEAIRLSDSVQRRVTSRMIDEAIERFHAGHQHNFTMTTDYDLLVPSTGSRLPAAGYGGLRTCA